MSATGNGTVFQYWRYNHYLPTSDPNAFGDFSSIVSLWQSKFDGNGQFPDWRQFDFYELEAWWGRLSLAEVSHDPFDLTFSLWGTKLTSWWGFDYTKKSLGNKPVAPNIWEPADRRYHHRTVSDKLIGFSTGPLDHYDREYRFVCAIDLPLERNGTVSHVLSAYCEVESIDDFSPALTPV